MPAEAVLAALEALWKAIGPLQRPAALLGGIALAIWRHPRFTQDVDLLLGLGETDAGQLVGALQAAGFRPKSGDGWVRLGELELLQMIYEPSDSLVEVQVDVLLAGNEYQCAALARRVPVTIAGLDSPVDVLSCEDVILHKLIAGRLIDRADAAALLRANRQSLDFGYLLHWITQQQLASEFAQVWEEAFPGEPLPRTDS